MILVYVAKVRLSLKKNPIDIHVNFIVSVFNHINCTIFLTSFLL
jgi:hypothetical protein